MIGFVNINGVEVETVFHSETLKLILTEKIDTTKKYNIPYDQYTFRKGVVLSSIGKFSPEEVHTITRVADEVNKEFTELTYIGVYPTGGYIFLYDTAVYKEPAHKIQRCIVCGRKIHQSYLYGSMKKKLGINIHQFKDIWNCPYVSFKCCECYYD